MYGAQTGLLPPFTCELFENDVEMYGAQTITHLSVPPPGLRMM